MIIKVPYCVIKNINLICIKIITDFDKHRLLLVTSELITSAVIFMNLFFN